MPLKQRGFMGGMMANLGNRLNNSPQTMPMRKPLQLPNFNRTEVPTGGNQSMQRQNMMMRPMQRPMRMNSGPMSF
jgi:hypothetical protein